MRTEDDARVYDTAILCEIIRGQASPRVRGSSVSVLEETVLWESACLPQKTLNAENVRFKVKSPDRRSGVARATPPIPPPSRQLREGRKISRTCIMQAFRWLSSGPL